jgi:hypothetical protein
MFCNGYAMKSSATLPTVRIEPSLCWLACWSRHAERQPLAEAPVHFVPVSARMGIAANRSD